MTWHHSYQIYTAHTWLCATDSMHSLIYKCTGSVVGTMCVCLQQHELYLLFLSCLCVPCASMLHSLAISPQYWVTQISQNIDVWLEKYVRWERSEGHSKMQKKAIQLPHGQSSKKNTGGLKFWREDILAGCWKYVIWQILLWVVEPVLAIRIFIGKWLIEYARNLTRSWASFSDVYLQELR